MIIGGGLGNAFAKLDDALDGVTDKIFGSTDDNPYVQKAKMAIAMSVHTQFIQGWQWSVELTALDATDNCPIEVPGMSELMMELYAKDIAFGGGNVESDSIKIGSGEITRPTHKTAGEVSMTLRDDRFHSIQKWFQALQARTVNQDGTVNLPKDYVLNMKVFSHFDDVLDPDPDKQKMEKTLWFEWQVFATKLGDYSLSYEQGNTFVSFPLTFQKFSTVGGFVF
ncbi:hypothetical protein [Thaumasiovibrio sp. DFM-14]|uniref:hypothetical protein n=1 Tax=Thaumasiovibrio sp. DFM-14 TaxID=3384792 RepID=UPI0039A22A7A